MKFLKNIFVLLLCCAFLPLTADDAQAAKTFADALTAFQEKNYIEAAELFAESENQAESAGLKLKAAMQEADSYRAAGCRGKEFDALEKIIKSYPTQIDFGAIVDREFAIGDAYYHGYRDPMFWSLRFIPWLTGKNRMEEIYEAALKHAPFAPAGGNARLRMAVHYLKAGENEKALKLLREIIRCYPDTEASQFAMLELGNALTQMSLTGDGDGQQFDEAMSVFGEFRKQYPDLSENEWVNQCEVNARNAYADRLRNVAKYYLRDGRSEPAQVYLLEVMRRFPDTKAAVECEEMLTAMDKSYFPERILPAIPPEYPKYEMVHFPKEERKLLLAPENSNGKFLLPIYDLNITKEKK